MSKLNKKLQEIKTLKDQYQKLKIDYNPGAGGLIGREILQKIKEEKAI